MEYNAIIVIVIATRFIVKNLQTLRCGKQILFSDEDKHFAMVWLGVLAVLCLISTLFALVTFLLDTERFVYSFDSNFLLFFTPSLSSFCSSTFSCIFVILFLPLVPTSTPGSSTLRSAWCSSTSPTSSLRWAT